MLELFVALLKPNTTTVAAKSAAAAIAIGWRSRRAKPHTIATASATRYARVQVANAFTSDSERGHVERPVRRDRAAVDLEDFAGDPLARRRAQIERGCRNVFRSSDAAERCEALH